MPRIPRDVLAEIIAAYAEESATYPHDISATRTNHNLPKYLRYVKGRLIQVRFYVPGEGSDNTIAVGNYRTVKEALKVRDLVLSHFPGCRLPKGPTRARQLWPILAALATEGKIRPVLPKYVRSPRPGVYFGQTRRWIDGQRVDFRTREVATAAQASRLIRGAITRHTPKMASS